MANLTAFLPMFAKSSTACNIPDDSLLPLPKEVESSAVLFDDRTTPHPFCPEAGLSVIPHESDKQPMDG